MPPLAVLGAAQEAMQAGISTLVIVTENVPVKDSALMFEMSKKLGCTILGPSSIGVLDTCLGKLGSIGNVTEGSMYTRGSVGVVSKSGGMCAETALALSQAGLGQSSIIGIGGDTIACSNMTDMLALLENDPDTNAVVMLGEIGGFYENQVADMVREKKFTKPLVAFISGQFAEKTGRNVALGHAGAIISTANSTARAKKRILRRAGVTVADYHHQIPDLIKNLLRNQK